MCVREKRYEIDNYRWHWNTEPPRLPTEIWLKIPIYLSPEELAQFGTICKDAYEISEHEILCKSLFRREQKAPVLFDFGSDWKSIFIMVRLTSQQKSTLALLQRLRDYQNELDENAGENKN